MNIDSFMLDLHAVMKCQRESSELCIDLHYLKSRSHNPLGIDPSDIYEWLLRVRGTINNTNTPSLNSHSTGLCSLSHLPHILLGATVIFITQCFFWVFRRDLHFYTLQASWFEFESFLWQKNLTHLEFHLKCLHLETNLQIPSSSQESEISFKWI